MFLFFLVFFDMILWVEVMMENLKTETPFLSSTLLPAARAFSRFSYLHLLVLSRAFSGFASLHLLSCSR